MKTWHAEAFVVAAVLAAVVIATGNVAREWIGAAGVLGSFLSAQVADRLAEREAARTILRRSRGSVNDLRLRAEAFKGD